jgi:cytochrome c oxidase subunit 2
VRTASAGAAVQTGQTGAPGPKPQASGKDTAAAAAPAAPADPAYAAGEKLFTAKGCVGCHSLQAVDAPKGMIGPNLANVGARTYIGAGSFKNTDENLSRWIQNPQKLKQGVLMPNLGVTPDEAKSLVAFLRAHK